MRSLGLGLLGLVIGILIPGSPMLFGISAGMWGFFIGSTIGAALDYSALPDTHGPRLETLSVQTTSYGVSIKEVFGRAAVAGNLIWASKKREHKKKEDSGGKGGSGPSVYSYSYDVDVMVMVCKGPIAGISRIWADSELIFDLTEKEGIDGAWAAKGSGIIRSDDYEIGDLIFYNGEENQAADTHVQRYVGVGLQPSHRGYATVLFKNFKLARFGNRVPNFRFEVVQNTTQVLQLVTSPTVSGSPIAQIAYSVEADATFIVTSNRKLHKFDLRSGAATTYDITRALQNYFRGPETDNSVCGIACANGKVYVSAYRISFDSPKFTAVFVFDAFTGRHENTFGYGDDWPAMGRATQGGLTYLGNRRLFLRMHDTMILIDSEAGVVYGELPSVGAESSFIQVALDGRNNLWVPTYYTSGALYVYDSRFQRQLARITDADLGGGPIAYSPELNWFVVAPLNLQTDKIVAFDATTFAKVQTWSIGASAQGVYMLAWDSFRKRFFFSCRGTPFNNKLHILNTDGTYTKFSNDDVPANNGFYAPTRHAIIGMKSTASPDTGAHIIALLDRLKPAPVTLQSVVESLCYDVGLESDEIDASDLSTSMLEGYVKDREMTPRAALQPLQQAFYFDIVQSGGVIKFVQRGKASVASIPYEDMGTVDGNTGTDDARFSFSRIQDKELPWRLTVEYMSRARNYDIASQSCDLYANTSEKETTLRLPVVLTDDRAATVAEGILRAIWLNRDSMRFSLPSKYFYLEPGDTVTIVEGSGKSWAVRLNSIQFGLPGRLNIEATADEPAIYTKTKTGVEVAPPDSNDTLYQIPIVAVELLDINAVTDDGDDAGFYAMVAPIGLSGSWEGGGLFRSYDDGKSYSQLNAFAETVVFGTTTTPLYAPRDFNVFDDVNTLTVVLFAGAIYSTTEDQLMLGENWAVVGDEIIAFQNVTDNGDGTYTLSRLLRGLRGTNYTGGVQALGSRFILLEENALKRISDNISERGVEYLYKGVSANGDLDKSAYKAFANDANALKPYSVSNLRGAFDGSLNLSLSWIRRARLMNEWGNAMDVPLVETVENYEFDVVEFKGATETVKRTSSVLTSPSGSYSRANQITDFGATGVWPVAIDVYQKSAIVGRGHVARLYVALNSATKKIAMTQYPVASGLPSGWKNLWASGADNYSVVASTTYTGENAFVLDAAEVASSDLRRAIAWKVTQAANVEILARFKVAATRSDTSPNHARFYVRASGVEGNETAYFVGLNSNLSGWKLMKYVRGASTTLASVTETISTSVRYWVRLRADGRTISAKIWEDGTSEPAAWEVVADDSDIPEGGDVAVGFYNGNDEATLNLYDFSVAENSATAT